MKNLFYALSAFLIFSLSSCGSVDCDDTAAQTALGTELGNAIEAYFDDPSDDNCKALKALFEESLDYTDCDGVTQEEIDNTNAAIADLDC